MPEIWSGDGSGAPLWSTSNAGLFCNEETEYGSRYSGTGHGSSSNQCGGFQNEGTEDGGEYGASETEEEDPKETDESLLLEDEDDVPEEHSCTWVILSFVLLKNSCALSRRLALTTILVKRVIAF
ncbi:hypothetical protein RHMOL_Rhmol04G0127300 [Rhododendron molle]|uniref:Uncharacterized protein n=1 Tax=Rhododendron molle TaxID=49168 RepID=A0ACC0P031_RHOML|nr:hypothetical protein RHMOL_Rhmol04G0127300 [Rhododendron molle]